MSFMIWYQVELAPVSGGGGLLSAAASLIGLGLPLRVSNDVFGGSFLLDADITVTMVEGAAVDSFEITLSDIPADTVELLQSTHSEGGLIATVRLGYFDEPATKTRTVVSGRVIRLGPAPDDNGRNRTVITGQETGGYLLRTTPIAKSTKETVPYLQFTTSLLPEGVRPAAGSTMKGTLRGYTTSAGSVLGAVQELARKAGAALVVRDGAVYLGDAVGSEQAPVAFDPETNIVQRVDGQEEMTPGAAASRKVSTTLQLIVLGHPDLRVGQIATVQNLDHVPAGPLRIARVVHRFATDGGTGANGAGGGAGSSAGSGAGYTCELLLVAAAKGEPAPTSGGVQGVVDRWQDVVGRHGDDHPAIDVGVVTTYAPGADGKHLASVDYGQEPAAAVVAPSIASPVTTTAELHDKPIAALFAFHNCGLVVPVYPKMRALLAHNRGLVNDAVVAGWLWSEEPRFAPPANKPGDWWLSLPTSLGGDGLPQGPGVNDLIDATGKRAVQATALHVTVGKPALPQVGTRPETPDENTITIEHHTGTKITVDAGGAVTITTDQKKLTLTNGAVSVTLDGAKVQVA